MSSSSASEKSTSSAKQSRRRCTSRRNSRNCDINAVEVRKEIFHALKLHRSSLASSSSSTSSATSSSSSSHVFVGPRFNSLVEAMPLPGPIWSTTAPSVLAHAPSSAAAAMEGLEFEWGENQASYSWWLGFLKTLDGNNAEQSKCPLPLGSTHSNWLFGLNQSSNCKEGDQIQETPLVDANDQSPSPDEWLMFPTTEDEGEIGFP